MKLPVLVLAGATLVCACTSPSGDPPAAEDADILGNGSRIHDVIDPSKPTKVTNNTTVKLTGASTVIVDDFDETHDGKSRGTVYIQDFSSTDPYSGISLFKPAFEPPSLRLAPGDVIDVTGPYQETSTIGSTVVFPAGEFLVQVSKPIVSTRFEAPPPAPRVIPLSDMANFAAARKWMSMVVTIQNVTIPSGSQGLVDDGKGRDTAFISNDTSQNGPIMTNELFDIKTWNTTSKVIKPGVTLKSLTGVVTFFFSIHIAPRSPDDIVAQ
jgi:hypothetical protein